MYEFYGWFEIAESTEESDAGGSARGLISYEHESTRLIGQLAKWG